MSTPFRLKRSAVSGKRPGLSDLQRGELALNFNDGYLFAERDTGGVGIGTTITLLTPWTENFGATSIYYENSVGIGTTNPTVTLDINGDVNVSGVSTFRDKVHLLDSDRLHFGGAAGDTGDLQIYHNNLDSWIQNTGGDLKISGDNVQILSAAGSSKIIANTGAEVALYYNDILRLETSGIGITVYNRLDVTDINASGITTTIQLNVGAGGTVITTTAGGLVGINSTAPTTTLDVNGDINFTGNLRQNGALFTAGIGIQSGGNVIVGSGATILNFTGTAVSAITDSGGGIVEINVKAGEFSKSTSNFTATAGQTTFNVTYTPGYIDVYVNGVRLTASEFTATNGTSVVLSEGANLNDVVDIVVYQNSGLFDGSKWTAETPATPSSGNIYRMNGNVGIATTNPTSKLHILGDALVSGVVTATGGYKIGIQSSSTNITTGVITALNFIGAGNTFQYNAGTKTVDISIGGGQWTYANESDTENSNVYRLNGNVGLGTTNPVAKLDVSGILGIQGNTTSISTTTATTIDTLPIATYRSARFQIQITQSNDYQSTDLMTVHDGTTATNIEYGSIATNDMLASFSSTISGSNLLLTVSMASAGIATVKVARYGITV